MHGSQTPRYDLFPLSKLLFLSEPPFIIRQAEVQSYQFLLAELGARLAYQLQNKPNFWLNYAHRDSTIALREL
jgi:hypothetical protein